MKSFSTIRADERLVVGVSAHVRVQVRGSVEGLGARDAHIRLDGRVREAVARQIARLSKGAVTHFTFERLVPRVNALQVKQINNSNKQPRAPWVGILSLDHLLPKTNT